MIEGEIRLVAQREKHTTSCVGYVPQNKSNLEAKQSICWINGVARTKKRSTYAFRGVLLLIRLLAY